MRKIPIWIGKVDVPENRATTIQLLRSLSEHLGECKNIEAIFKQLGKPLPTDMFIAQAKEAAIYLANVLDERKLPNTRNDQIWVGHPKFDLGHLNVKLATILHQYFDAPDYKIKGKHPPITQEQVQVAVQKERNDESPCDKPC